MEEQRKHAEVTKELAKVVGELQPGTRIYRADGDDEAYRRWWDVLSQHFPRGLVSPGGACPHAGVSRAAIHKAVREGRLTIFTFHPHKEQRGLFGSKVVRRNPYGYMPVIELKAWRLELEERVGELRASGATLAKIKKQLNAELEGEKPDWNAYWLDEHPDGRVVRKKGKG